MSHGRITTWKGDVWFEVTIGPGLSGGHLVVSRGAADSDDPENFQGIDLSVGELESLSHLLMAVAASVRGSGA